MAMGISGFKAKKDEVLNHTISCAPDFSFPAPEFYGLVEKALKAKKFPGLEISRVEYAEGGIFSNDRIYLRFIRERLAFDTCAASFGTDYFFSSRTVYSPVQVKLWHVLVALGFFGGVFCALLKPLGLTFDCIAVAALVIAIARVFRNTIALKLHDLDAALIKMPVVGPIYGQWFRKDTYFRQDTRLMYLEVIPHLIQSVIDEITAAKGVKLVRSYHLAPILGELYKPMPPRKAEPEK